MACDADIPHHSAGSNPNSIQLPANVPGETAETDPSIWASATLLGDSDEISGFWFQMDPDLAFGAIWGKIFISVYHSAFQINKS